MIGWLAYVLAAVGRRLRDLESRHEPVVVQT
jgi:hypothetical protein